MSISQKDKEFMEKVAAYFRNTKTPTEPDGSIRDTARAFDINRNKVRKILITMGELQSPYTDKVIRLRDSGMSIRDIARDLGISTATVSTSLPYESKVDHTLDPTEHASDVRDYRAYEKEQKKRQAQKKRQGMQERQEQNKRQRHKESQDQEKRQAGKDRQAAFPDANKATTDRKGKNMAEDKGTNKEWQKDIRMSYTEAYHRPHRNTWEDVEKIRKEMEAQMAAGDTDEAGGLSEELTAILKKATEEKAEKEKEYEQLKEKKAFSDEEKIRLGELEHELGLYKGALGDRDRKILEEIAGDRLPPEPVDVIRLHLELYDDYDSDEITQILKKYGNLKYGERISRDIAVPEDLPLYALHYVIQRAFGWQNSHLREFELPEEVFRRITHDNASMWSCLVGVLFRSPLMDENDEFWADDYNGGSFKNWLRKKYTGPYLSQCRGERILSCQEDMMRLDMGAEYYVLYQNAWNAETGKYDGAELISMASPEYDYQGRKREAPKPWSSEEISYRMEVMNFEELPAEALKFIFERNPMALLERLPISSVLAVGTDELPDGCSEKEREYIDGEICSSGQEIYGSVGRYMKRIIEAQVDSPEVQVVPPPVTDTLYYHYDFGDGWKIRITASRNCPDLVTAGRITQSELDSANVKCREVYRPVLLARDGEMLIDDVGGLHGFTEFLGNIHPELEGLDPDEKADRKQEKKDSLTWAKSQGWHKDNSSDFNLL